MKIHSVHTILATMAVLLSLILSLANIQNSFTSALALVSTCFIPGFLLLKKLRIRLEFHEMIPISIVLSMAILVLLSLYLSISPFHITSTSVLSSILLLVTMLWTFSYLLGSGFRNGKLREGYSALLNGIKEKKAFIFLIFITGALSFILLLPNIFKHEYFLGYDPFRNRPIVSSIIEEKLNPEDLLSQRIVFSGFFFFAAAFHASTGVSLYSFTRFGGLVFLSLISLIMFIMMHRIFKHNWVAIIPFFYVTNMFVDQRFLMTIRENLSFLFLMLLVFFLLKLEEKAETKSITLISVILSSAILSTHPITLFFSWFLVFCLFLARRDRLPLILVLLGGLVLTLPMLTTFLPWLKWFLTGQLQRLLGWEVTVPTWLPSVSLTSSWGRNIRIEDFSMLEIALLPLGILYVLKRRFLLKTHSLFFIIPLSMFSLAIYLSTKIGTHFTVARLNIYISVPLAILSGLGLRAATNRFIEHLPNVITLTRKKILADKTIRVFAITAILAPIILFNSLTSLTLSKWSPYGSDQVDAAEWLKEQIEGVNTIVIPSPYDVTLVEYVGVDNTVLNRDLIDKTMNVTSFTELKHLISANYPKAKKCFFFMSERWLSLYEKSYNFKLLGILNDFAEIAYQKSSSQGAIIFRLNLL